MSKKGFTLVELLTVIIVLGIIVSIAIPSVMGIYGIIEDNILDSKVTMIEESAVMFGQDIKRRIISSTKKYKTFKCDSFIVSDLVPHYLDKDNDNSCLVKSSTGTKGCIVDPRDEDKYLDKYEVIIYYQNKRIKAVVDTKNELTCS